MKKFFILFFILILFPAGCNKISRFISDKIEDTGKGYSKSRIAETAGGTEKSSGEEGVDCH